MLLRLHGIDVPVMVSVCPCYIVRQCYKELYRLAARPVVVSRRNKAASC